MAESTKLFAKRLAEMDLKIWEHQMAVPVGEVHKALRAYDEAMNATHLVTRVLQLMSAAERVGAAEGLLRVMPPPPPNALPWMLDAKESLQGSTRKLAGFISQAADDALVKLGASFGPNDG